MNFKITIPFLILLVSQTVSALPIAKITVKVINEQGQPIEGAEARLTFYVGKSRSKSGVEGVDGLTDKDGLFTGSGASPQHVRYGASKEGYYGTSDEIRMESITNLLVTNHWEPWNPTVEVVLKKKENPIAMYVYRMDNLTKTLPELPFLNRFVGYDLIARDWVIPHGVGTHRDILFKLEKHNVTRDEGYSITFTIVFENEDDGIQSYYTDPNSGSQLRLPHHAPVNGYKHELVINKARTSSEILSGKSREDQNYFFRTRTERDDKGNITSALYGKIYGYISPAGFVVLPTSKVRFNYYLNPTPNDTNVEFDPEKNLFKNLSVNEQVFKP